MDRMSDQFLSRSALSHDENRHRALGKLRCQLFEFFHHGALADELVKRVLGSRKSLTLSFIIKDLPLQVGHLAQELLEFSNISKINFDKSSRDHAVVKNGIAIQEGILTAVGEFDGFIRYSGFHYPHKL